MFVTPCSPERSTLALESAFRILTSKRHLEFGGASWKTKNKQEESVVAGAGYPICRKSKEAWTLVVKEAKISRKTKLEQALTENKDKPFPDGNRWWGINIFRLALKLPVLCWTLGNVAYPSKCNVLFDSFSFNMAIGIVTQVTQVA